MSFFDFFKSRYTRSLEDRVRELRNEIDHKNAQIALLQSSLFGTQPPRQAVGAQMKEATGFATNQPAAKARTEKELPKVGNWLKSRDAAEVASDTRRERFDKPQPSTRRNSDKEE